MARLAAWAVAALIVAISIAYGVLYAAILSYDFQPYGYPGAVAVFCITAAFFGALVVSRQPRNGVGWVLLGSAFCLATTSAAQVYTIRGQFVAPGSLPAIWLSAWLGSFLWAPGVASITTLLLVLFPESSLPGWPAKVLFSAGALLTVGTALYLAAITFPGTGTVTVGPDGQLTGTHSLAQHNAFGAVYALIPLVSLAALIRLGLRLRASSGTQRQQYKWLAYACGVVVVGIAASAIGNLLSPSSTSNAPVGVLGNLGAAALVTSLLAVPAGAGIAILRYRLYDVDIVISRTIVYGALAVAITAVYVAIVTGIGSAVHSAGRENLLLSIVATAIVAVAFQPLRGRMQRLANRVVYGKQATPYEVLSAFSEGVAETYAGEDVLQRMARLLADATAAEQAVVWIVVGSSLQPAAASPADSVPGVIYGVTAGQLPDMGGTVVPVRHQGELLGALTVVKRRGEALTPVESKLLQDLALQAGLVLRNAGLAESLKLRVEDLRESRRRLVAAQDDERRRLERNLHDGAQQNLVALKVKLGLLRAIAIKDPEKAAALAGELSDEAGVALETLRDLARGIYPPLLADKGLAAAIEAQARKATLRVSVDADGIGRYPQETETAVYFCVLEALQNTQKYASATSAVVRLREDKDRLSFEVHDDGVGFDPVTARRGSGTQNMEDRLDALGGQVTVISAPGKGTTVTGELPTATSAFPEASRQ